MLIALLLLTLPGVGFVAWRNPLLLAGLLFPGLGLLGLLATAALFALMAAGGFSWQPKRKAITIAGAAAVTLALGSMWSLQRNPVIDLDGWVGMDTAIEPENMRNRREVREVVPGEVAAQALTAALEENATVVVLPESILAPATLADEIALLPAAEKARKKGAVLLLGETIRTDAVSWRNTIRAVGAVEGTFAESRLPMPFGNWQLSGGVPVRPFASDVSVLNLPSGPINVATSLCFEDTVILPHLGLLTGQADVLVSTANSWATAGTRGDETQTLSAKLLARLGGVPLVRARNTYEGAMK